MNHCATDWVNLRPCCFQIPMPVECTMHDLCDLLQLDEEETLEVRTNKSGLLYANQANGYSLFLWSP
jgi:hypothetical protein